MARGYVICLLLEDRSARLSQTLPRAQAKLRQLRQQKNTFGYWTISGAANLKGYRPGGYHLVNIRDVYSNGRYQVVNKLSSGGFALFGWREITTPKDMSHSRFVEQIAAIT
jgi:hypothetical protein